VAGNVKQQTRLKNYAFFEILFEAKSAPVILKQTIE